MSTPHSPQDPFNVQGLIGRKIAESLGQELVNGIMGGGAKRGLEAGMDMAKDVKLGDIFATVGKVFEDVNTARATATATATKQEEVKEVFIPFMKEEENPEASPKASTIRIVPVPVDTPEAPAATKTETSSIPPAPVFTTPVPPANESIDAIYEIATSKLTSEEQAVLVSSVMNLVRHASPEGFTGEHVRWLSRLYGNKSL